MENGSRIIQGAKEALAIASGELNPSTYMIHVPETVDGRSIREKLHMTQGALPFQFQPGEAAGER